MDKITYHDALRVLKPDFETGKLFWLPRPLDVFPNARTHDMWNTRFANKEAFTTAERTGYLSGKIFARGYLAHRVIWLLATGAWPVDQIDHINGVRTDNRLANLREATNSDNMRNLSIGRRNTSGALGVSWHKPLGMWQAKIRFEGRDFYLGVFRDIEDAIAARKAAEKFYNFHENHGRPK